MSQTYNPPGLLDIADVVKELFTDPSDLSWESYFNPRTYLNNLPVIGDVANPLSQSQIQALAAQGYASTIKAGGSVSDAQTTAAAVANYGNTQTSDTSTLDSFTNGFASWVPSMPDISGWLIPGLVVIALAFGVYFVGKRVK